MHNKISIVDQNPIGVVIAFHVHGLFALARKFFADAIADGLNLARIGAGGNDEVVGERGDFSKVQNADFDGLLGFGSVHGSKPERSFEGVFGQCFASALIIPENA